MKHASIAIMFTVLLSAVALVAAQASPAAVSGQWGQGGRTLLDLQAGAKGAVTGTVFLYEGATRHVARVGAGSFDDKAALKLSGEATRDDGSRFNYEIAGALDGDTLRVTYAFAREKGTAVLMRMTRDRGQRNAIP